ISRSKRVVCNPQFSDAGVTDLSHTNCDSSADEGGAPGRPSAAREQSARIWRLFLAFMRVGAFGFGGGPSMIPLVRTEVVKTNAWMSDEEFMELYAVASSLPGPISTNLAGFFGWRVAGAIGSMAALL